MGGLAKGPKKLNTQRFILFSCIFNMTRVG